MNIKELYEDYEPVNDIFQDEPLKIQRVKYIIFHKLKESDRRIIILYAELQSIRKVAQKLNVSAASAWLQIDRIRKEIKNLM